MNKGLDDTIIKQLREGDTSCFEAILRNYRNYCVGGLMKKIRCTEQVAQDYFIEGILELREMVISGKTDVILNLKSYLFGISYNLWLTDQKKNIKISSSISDVERYFYGYLFEDNVFEDEIEYRSKLMSTAKRAISLLTEKCQKILTYYYIDNKNMSEIAEKLNFSGADVAKTSKSRCFQKLLNEVDKLPK